MIGLDISNHQKGIRLANLPRQDVYIFKASQGSQYPDAYFDGFVQQALDLGARKIGAYWWLESHEPVQQQHTVFMRKIAPWLERGIPLVPIMDWEPKDPSRVDIATDGMRRLKASLGGDDMPPQIYMNHGVANRFRWQPIRDLGCRLWLAHYGANNGQRNAMPTPSGWEGKVMGHQYTDRGRLPGWGGNLDLNHFDWWPEAPRKDSPVTVSIPVLRENDPLIWLKDVEGRSFKGCECMKRIMPIFNQKLREAGLVKRGIDVMQGGYNASSVAASAKTHNGGGVWDMRPLYRDHAKAIRIGQELGIVVFWRNWRNNEHYHCLILGCPHQHAEAEAQLSGWIGYLNKRDGLARPSTFWGPWGYHPKGGWQAAYIKHMSAPAATKAIEHPKKEDAMRLMKYRFTHKSTGNGFEVVREKGKGWEAGLLTSAQGVFLVEATAHAPGDVTLTSRVVELARPKHEWRRRMETIHKSNFTHISEMDDFDGQLFLDLKTSKPCEVTVEVRVGIWDV